MMAFNFPRVRKSLLREVEVFVSSSKTCSELYKYQLNKG